MNRSQHTSNNHVLGAPVGMNIDECSALPITVIQYTDTVGLRSFWKPTEEELKLLVAGSFVTIEILGSSHPPIIVGVE